LVQQYDPDNMSEEEYNMYLEKFQHSSDFHSLNTLIRERPYWRTMPEKEINKQVIASMLVAQELPKIKKEKPNNL
jgi:hypothetical protein